MRALLSFIILVGSLQAQEVARVAGAATFATSGRFFVTTRQPPAVGGVKPAPEVYEIITGKDGAASVALGALGNVKMEANTHIRMRACMKAQPWCRHPPPVLACCSAGIRDDRLIESALGSAQNAWF